MARQMNDVIDFHASRRLVPVVVMDDVSRVPDLTDALAGNGLPSAEVTLRTPAALAAIEAMAQVPGFVVGAGTVVRPDQVEPAITAGARYLVSPGYSRSVARECGALGILLIPGVATATELQAALEGGHEVVKFFPAGIAGGAAAIEALSGPFPSVRFIPTGGVDEHTLAEYLRVPSVLAVGGTWMTPRSLVRDSEFEQIARLTAAAVAIAEAVR
jgi:2-dehydro-3-deoxyphosphogluconate aldolase/(4S)-4-hydroxy-2-oxoglutarate aldolase